MNVGDFVRTKNGTIAKIKGIFEIANCVFLDVNNYAYSKEKIIKSSPQIIDLIEVGDYVNGFYVINKPFNNRIHTEFDDFLEEDIETILTHEQMEVMQYRVEE